MTSTRSRSSSLLILASFLIATLPFQAIAFFSEDFEGFNLGPYVSPTETPSLDGLDWTDELPTGWQLQYTGPTGDPIEFEGWRIHNIDSWIATEGDQQRSTWSNPGVNNGGSALLVDPDAFDDGTNIDTGLFNTWITTPAFDLSAFAPNSIELAFDSFWRNEVTQIGTVDVSFDGGTTYENLLTYDSSVLANGALIDRRENFQINNPANGSLVFRFGMTNASNDWWWAIDNVDITSDPQFGVIVNRDTGQITFNSDPVSGLGTQGYSLYSAGGALNADQWQSIDGNADANAGGSFDPNADWVRFSADGARDDLSEGVLGTTTIAAGSSHDFGSDVWIQYWDEDLVLEYLDGNGDLQIGRVTFIGNNDQPFAFGDLTFDGQLDALDWLEFQANLGGEFFDLSIAESYQRGDLNGDLETDHGDFRLFKSTYDAANGAGAFDAMIRSIPEPSSIVLILIASASLVALRRKSLPVLVLTLFVGVHVDSGHAQILMFEDFESLNLLDSDLGTDGDDETDWTNVGPSGWDVDFRNTPFEPTRPEFQGWTYMDRAFWIDQQGPQIGRDQFLAGFGDNNTIALVDPDAHDDFIDNDPNLFSSVMTSRTVDLSNVTAPRVRVSFDSSWAPEDLQEVQFNVVFDGVRTTLFTWDSEANANFKPTTLNERVELIIETPVGASNMQLEWDMVEAGNDWWWAIDNVLVESTENTSAMTLAVNRDTGAARIENTTGQPVAFDYYEVQSPAGSLLADDFPAGWNSLDDQDFDAIGSGVGQSWDEGELSDEFELVEAYLLSNSIIGDGDAISIGNAYDEMQDAADLQFFYAGPDGALIEGEVRYDFGGGNSGDFDGNGSYECADIDSLVAAIAGNSTDLTFDLTGDGVVDRNDLTAWLAEAGAAELASGNPFLNGDANLSGVVDVSDFNIWNANKFTNSAAWCLGDFNADGVVDTSDFNLWNMNKFTTSDMAAVPEANSLWAAMLGCVVIVMLQRRS